MDYVFLISYRTRVRSNYGFSMGVSVINRPCGNASFAHTRAGMAIELTMGYTFLFAIAKYFQV